MILGLVVFLAFKDGRVVRETVVTSSVQEQAEKEEEFRRAFGDIGGAATTKNFEFVVNKLDCTQTSLRSTTEDVQKASKRGKLCVISLTVKNISDQVRSFSTSNALLVTSNTHGRYYWFSAEVQYSSDSELEALSGEQVFEVSNQSGRICLARFSMKNISNEFRQGSPDAPNITYQGVYSAFWNHSLYLVDSEGNRYAEFWGRYIYTDGSYDSWQEIIVPTGDDYIDGSKDIAPGDALDTFVVFLLPSGSADPASIDFDRPFYTYDIFYSSTDDSASSVSFDALSTSESVESGSQLPGRGGVCPTCGNRNSR